MARPGHSCGNSKEINLVVEPAFAQLLYHRAFWLVRPSLTHQSFSLRPSAGVPAQQISTSPVFPMPAPAVPVEAPVPAVWAVLLIPALFSSALLYGIQSFYVDSPCRTRLLSEDTGQQGSCSAVKGLQLLDTTSAYQKKRGFVYAGPESASGAAQIDLSKRR